MIASYPLQVGNIFTRILECGVGPNVAVFLHGVGARADRWVSNLPAFAQAGYRCIAIDLPGHGFATKSSELRFDPESMQAFLLDVLQELQIDRCVWIGTSFGGLLSLNMAIKRPTMVAGMVLIGCLGLHAITREACQRMAAAIQVSTRDGARSKLKRLVFEEALVTDLWTVEEYRVNSSTGASAAMRELAEFIESPEGLGAINFAGELPELAASIPTALVWGNEDRSVPVAVGQKAALTAPVTWIGMERACHAPYLERSTEFNNSVLAFLGNASLNFKSTAGTA